MQKILTKLIALTLAMFSAFALKCVPDREMQSEIVLLDLDNWSRDRIGRVISELTLYDPKVIAINGQFLELHGDHADSVLAKSIAESGRIILSAAIDDETLNLVRSHSFFGKGALDEGVLSYIVEENQKSSKYIPLFQNESEQATSFPTAIAIHSGKFKEGLSSLKINAHLTFVIEKEVKDFAVVTEGTIDEHNIKDKIIILGDLQDIDENLIYVSIDGHLVKVSSTVLVANIVESL